MISDTGFQPAEQLAHNAPIPPHLQALLRRCKLQSCLFSVRHCNKANNSTRTEQILRCEQKKKTSKKLKCSLT